ncbi:FecR family protein [Porticoccus sp. W117]|uniref:FecR family protein n=1 Tax=Porticoccus sp. W117 TaxID=3054777 RepID=UPI002592E1D8|nr:FecR family protein [Porticoccus sp. W117]MDM3870856.1 FecR family protein [Porticoccus sp. W117]
MSELAQPQSRDDLFDQACAWVVRLRAEKLANSELEQFADWVSKSANHRAAFDQVAEMWGDLGVASKLPLEQPATESSSTECSKPSWLQQWFSWRAAGAFAATAAIVVALVITLVPSQQLDRYHTAIGESLAITLDDGSQVELNTNSTLEVSYSDEQRWLHLIDGEAYFSVAKDKQRPFVVELDGAQAQAVGTAFNIYKTTDEAAEITVTEGTVQVTHQAQPSLPKFVEVGQAISFDSKDGLRNLRAIDSDLVTAWRQSQIVFDNTPLSDVVTTLNRYSKTPIELAATDSAQLPISGTFSTERPLETAQAVAEALALTATLNNDRLRLHKSSDS